MLSQKSCCLWRFVILLSDFRIQSKFFKYPQQKSLPAVFSGDFMMPIKGAQKKLSGNEIYLEDEDFVYAKPTLNSEDEEYTPELITSEEELKIRRLYVIRKKYMFIESGGVEKMPWDLGREYQIMLP